MRLQKCFACYHGYDSCIKKDGKLPRKKKKKLKKYYDAVRPYFYTTMDYLQLETSCNLKQQYRSVGERLRFTNYFIKNRDKINFIMQVIEDNYLEGAAIFDWNLKSFEFYWTYDDDNGLYCSSGSMPFIYQEEDFNETWSGEETKSLLKQLRIKFGSVNNGKELISAVNIKETKEYIKKTGVYF